MRIPEANAKAMELAKKLRKEFFLLSETRQAELIGTTWATWSKTKFYTTAKKRRQELTGEQSRSRESRGSMKTVPFTPQMQAVLGEGQPGEVLNQVIERDQTLARLTAEETLHQLTPEEFQQRTPEAREAFWKEFAAQQDDRERRRYPDE